MGFISMLKAIFVREPKSRTVDLALAMSDDVARDAQNLTGQLQHYLHQEDPLAAFAADLYNRREGVISRVN